MTSSPAARTVVRSITGRTEIVHNLGSTTVIVHTHSPHPPYDWVPAMVERPDANTVVVDPGLFTVGDGWVAYTQPVTVVLAA